jgi:hypothetical protein
MKRISILGLVAVLVVASATARAQDFTAGKTPAQLFGSDCAECHRSPAGLAKNRDQRTLASFLREHYTTKSDTAGALAAYVSGFAGATPPPEPNSRRGAASAPEPNSRRSAAAARREPEPDDEVRFPAKPPEEQPARRRRAVSMSGDGEKRRPRDDTASRGLGGISSGFSGARETVTLPQQRVVPRGHAPAAEATGRPGNIANPGEGAASLSGGTADTLARLKAYVTSGQDFEAVAADAAKAHSENAPHEAAVAPVDAAIPALPSDGGPDGRAAAIGAPSVILAPAPPAGAPAPAESNPAPASPAATAPAALVAPAAPTAGSPAAAASAVGAGLKPAPTSAPVAAGAPDTAGSATANLPAPATEAPPPSMAGTVTAPKTPSSTSSVGGIGGADIAAPTPTPAMPRPPSP